MFITTAPMTTFDFASSTGDSNPMVLFVIAVGIAVLLVTGVAKATFGILTGLTRLAEGIVTGLIRAGIAAMGLGLVGAVLAVVYVYTYVLPGGGS